MADTRIVSWISAKYELALRELDERSRRRWAAIEAVSLGRGGIVAVAQATGLARTTIQRGIRELDEPDLQSAGRQRRPGGGRKRADEADLQLMPLLEKLLAAGTSRQSSPLRWTCKSTRLLAHDLTTLGHPASSTTIARLLKSAGYDLYARRTAEAPRRDREGQFRHLVNRVSAYQRARQPVIAIELGKSRVGRRKSARGRALPTSKATTDLAVGRATSTAIGLSIGQATAELAVEGLSRWWNRLGKRRFPQARRILVLVRLSGNDAVWKAELRKSCDAFGLEIETCHIPAGTTKWMQVEHRLLCQVMVDRPGRPAEVYRVVVQSIGPGGPEQVLELHEAWNQPAPRRNKRSAALRKTPPNLQPAVFQPLWNYTIKPAAKPHA